MLSNYGQSEKYVWLIQNESKRLKITFTDSLHKAKHTVVFKKNASNSLTFITHKKDTILIDVNNEDYKKLILDYLKINYVDSQYLPSTLPIIYVALIIDKNGVVLTKGIARGSTDKYFQEEIFRTVKNINVKFPILMFDNKSYKVLYILMFSYYDLLKW